MTDCICAQHGDLECPIHPDCASCGCQAHTHWPDGDRRCIAGRFGCGCKGYRPGDPEDYEVPTRIVVDDKICEEMENPRPPTEAMRRLFEPAGLTDDEIRGVLHDRPISGDPTGLDAYLDPSVGLSKAEYAEWEDRICGTFDPAERAREKQASRDADAQALADGTKTREQLRRENASFAFPRDRVKLTPPKRER